MPQDLHRYQTTLFGQLKEKLTSLKENLNQIPTKNVDVFGKIDCLDRLLTLMDNDQHSSEENNALILQFLSLLTLETYSAIQPARDAAFKLQEIMRLKKLTTTLGSLRDHFNQMEKNRYVSEKVARLDFLLSLTDAGQIYPSETHALLLKYLKHFEEELGKSTGLMRLFGKKSPLVTAALDALLANNAFKETNATVQAAIKKAFTTYNLEFGPTHLKPEDYPSKWMHLKDFLHLVVLINNPELYASICYTLCQQSGPNCKIDWFSNKIIYPTPKTSDKPGYGLLPQIQNNDFRQSAIDKFTRLNSGEQQGNLACRDLMPRRLDYVTITGTTPAPPPCSPNPKSPPDSALVIAELSLKPQNARPESPVGVMRKTPFDPDPIEEGEENAFAFEPIVE